MNIITTGLGAGSYPEPPELEEWEEELCDRCRGDFFVSYSGEKLCDACFYDTIIDEYEELGKVYLRENKEDFMEFLMARREFIV